MAVRELTDSEKAELNSQPGVLSRLAIGSNLQEMQRAINAGGTGQPYARIVDKKSSGTPGGTFTSGAWRTRDLNTLQEDQQGIVTSLSSNQFKLAEGQYRIQASAPAFSVKRHRAAIYNVTQSSFVLLGTSEYSKAPTETPQTRSFASGLLLSNGSDAFELRHRCGETSPGLDGFGVESSFGVDEIYSVVEIFGA